MTLVPLKNKLLVKRDELEQRVGSIWIPETLQDRPHRGTVIATGPQVTWVKEGDVIRYSAKGRPDIKLHGEPHQIIAEQDIYGVET